MAWSVVLPRGSSVAGTRFERLAPVLDFINPGEFRLKEVSCMISFAMVFSDVNAFQHVVATLVASTAAYGNTAVMNFAVWIKTHSLPAFALAGG